MKMIIVTVPDNTCLISVTTVEHDIVLRQIKTACETLDIHKNVNVIDFTDREGELA